MTYDVQYHSTSAEVCSVRVECVGRNVMGTFFVRIVGAPGMGQRETDEQADTGFSFNCAGSNAVQGPAGCPRIHVTTAERGLQLDRTVF